MKTLHCVAALVVALVSGSASAEMFNGNKLLDILKKAEVSGNNVDWGMGHGYVAGVYDSNAGVTFCSPGSMTLGQLTDMTKNYLENNPAVRHLPAESIIVYFMSKTWPCAKKGNGV